LRDEQGLERIGPQTSLSLIHDAIAAQLWSTKSLSWYKLQDLNMQVQGSQKLPNEWWNECQVAFRDKYTCIDKSELKSMY